MYFLSWGTFEKWSTFLTNLKSTLASRGLGFFMLFLFFFLKSMKMYKKHKKSKHDVFLMKQRTKGPAMVVLHNISYAFQTIKSLGRESKHTRMRKGSVCFRPFQCRNVQICPAAPTGCASSVPSIKQEPKGMWLHPNREMQMKAHRRAKGRMMRMNMNGW
jgi:hypothetical protein